MEKEKKAAPKPTKMQKRAVLILGTVLLLLGVYLLVFLVPDVIATLPGPQRLTLAEAAEVASGTNTYAIIEDGRWDCNTIEYVRGPSSTNRMRIETRFTEVFLTTVDDSVAMFVTMSGEYTCMELQRAELTGYLTRMSESTQTDLTNQARLARFFNAETFLDFCGYCGLENSAIGLIAGVISLILGIALLLFGRRIKLDEDSADSEV